MGRKLALISDLHSNIEAAENVLKDIDSLGVSEIVCLGDVIGYGPNPRELIKHAMGWKWCLRGNHEDALLFLALDFNHEAAQAIDWTRDQINDRNAPKDENHKMWNFLGDLGDIKVEDEVTFLHASPRNRTKEYVRPHDIQDQEKMEEIFSMIRRLCFCGHTHEPGVFTADMKFYPPAAFEDKFKVDDNRKYFINIGSVGQPRDRDTRACYVTWDVDSGVVEYRRLEYDFKATMKKIFSVSRLPKRFGERLKAGR
ncbi:MAG: metallophosphoesterase family protein [Planctomycetota bacterium]|jgi:predicted phosphodiesterase